MKLYLDEMRYFFTSMSKGCCEIMHVLVFLVVFGPATVHGIPYAACLDSYSSMVKWSHSGGEGAALPSTLQGVSVKQGIADVPFEEAACVLFLLYARSEEQPNWNKEREILWFFFLSSSVSALRLLKLCARKVWFDSRRVIMRKIRDPDGRKMI